MPNLHVLATSRERLRLRDEVEIHVSSLAAADAARLFAERSGLAPDEPIARLCDALDGLPLAIELAAARTAVLSPTQILKRIGRRLDLFRGARDLDPRQQTLRATIDWSYELLDDAERRLFARLAVFAGGCTLEAAEEIAGAELDTLEALVCKSLVLHASERFWMLETIREYALERLTENPDAATLRDRHADWFLALAEQAASRLETADQALWLDRIEQEYPNVREALRGDARAARFITGLRYFWVKRGYLAEGRRIAEEHLPAVPDDDPAKPMALATASHLAVMQGDWPAAIAHGERCRELALEHEDERAAVEVASVLGRALLAVGQEERAVRSSRTLWREAQPMLVRLSSRSACSISATSHSSMATYRRRGSSSSARSRRRSSAATGTHTRGRSPVSPPSHSRTGTTRRRWHWLRGAWTSRAPPSIATPSAGRSSWPGSRVPQSRQVRGTAARRRGGTARVSRPAARWSRAQAAQARAGASARPRTGLRGGAEAHARGRRRASSHARARLALKRVAFAERPAPPTCPNGHCVPVERGTSAGDYRA